jgi:hypothetical protein
MPSNQINSENWTIDNFRSQIFPTISSVNDYRTFIFNQNLPDVDPEISNRVHKATLDSRGTETNIQSLRLTDPGNINEWAEEGGYLVGVHEIRDIGMLRSQNKYGPEFIEAYNCPELIPEATGFIQYRVSPGGDIRSTLLGQQLGFGIGAGIEFQSELADIGKERRKTEVLNRIKANAAQNTLGKLNLDPLGLLAGQDLITKDYTITKGTGLGGQIFDFATDLVGFNVPTSIIPDGAFGQYGDLNDFGESNDAQAYEAILKFTGAGQKSLLFNSLSENRYGPTLQTPDSSSNAGGGSGISNVIKGIQNFTQKVGGPGDPPVLRKYIDNVDDIAQVEQTEERQKSIVDKVNEAVGKTIDGLKNKIVGDVPEWESPSVDEDDISKIGNYGFDTLPSKNTPGRTWQYDDMIGVNMNPTDIPTDNRPFRDLMYWGARSNKFKKGILKYTQEILNRSVDEPRAKARFIGNIDNDANFKDGKHQLQSKGNTVTDEDGLYCRSWSTRRPYSKVSDMVRHRGLDKENSNLSVLDDNGFVKITPYVNEQMSVQLGEDGNVELAIANASARRYMLSLENLAWQDTKYLQKIPKCEIGPNGGRIMWFPPYDINFTDNTSVNWDTTNFIGRGEPIYTYNNTERTGTLSFKLVVDHPSAFNKPDENGVTLREQSEDILFRFFAGCQDVEQIAEVVIPKEDLNDVEVQETEEEVVEEFVVQEPQQPPVQKTSGYFSNAGGCRVPSECERGTTIGDEIGAGYDPGGLNTQFVSDIQALTDFLITDDGKRYQIVIDGHTSGAAPSSFNDDLAKLRADGAKEYILSILIPKDSGTVVATNLGSTNNYKTEKEQISDSKRWAANYFGESQAKSDPGDEDFDDTNTDPNAQQAIDDRRVDVTLKYNPDIDSDVIGKVAEDTSEDLTTTNGGLDLMDEEDTETLDVINERLREEKRLEKARRLAAIANRHIGWECAYFQKMQQDDPFVYETLTEKLRYFHPAFHSMTPEGFNSRLTFLQQCTRQGPSVAKDEPYNMAFGKPPICVLRVGDFYHTKIVIDTVNFTFDPLQWDLNPEGIGVQPMVATVDLNFKFIGGSSLGGPINELQNAVSFNFFANTALYNPRKLYKNIKNDIQKAPNKNSDLPEEVQQQLALTGLDDPAFTVTADADTFQMGAYLYPGQEATKDADDFTTQTVGEPPKDTASKLNSEQNKETTPKKAELSEEEKDAIEEESTTNEATVDDDLKKVSLGVVEFNSESDLYFEMNIEGQLSNQYNLRPRLLDRTSNEEYVGFTTELKGSSDSYTYLIDNGDFTPDIEEYDSSHTYRLKVDILYRNEVEKTYNANL